MCEKFKKKKSIFKTLINYINKIKLNFNVLYKYLTNIKISYKSKKIDILVLDERTKKNFFYLKKTFSVEFIPTRGERINIIILLKAIWYFLSTKLSLFESYILAYINWTNAKILVSAVENSKFFNIKTIKKDIKIIFFQYDYKSKESLKFLNKVKIDIDLIFCTGSYWKKHLSQYSKNKIEYLPSLYSHRLSSLKKKVTKNIFYISTYRSQNSYKSRPNFFYEFHYKKDFFILNILKKILIKKNIKLNIIQTYKKEEIYFKRENSYEKKYFIRMLSRENINFLDSSKKKILSDDQSLFINLDSALGFQLAALGKKCVFFPIRKRKNQQVQFHDSSNYGLFWSKKMNYKKVRDIILNNYKENSNKNLAIKKYVNNYFIVNPKISFKEVNDKIKNLVK